jgi:PDZ domain-containing protein
MRVIALKSGKRSKSLWLEFTIAAILMLIPAGVAVFFFYPSYYWFSGTGEIVSVQEIGVDGSVHFTYVNEGVVSNLYERIAIRQQMPDVEFEPADYDVDEEFQEFLDYGEVARNETIFNAVLSADAAAEQHATDEELDDRLEQLIWETSDYYGDSIGLMLAIGLAEEAAQTDFSQGGKYVIAGTGTLEEDFYVGSVGAIRNKLRTAENAGADIFFVPKDYETYFYEGISNEEEAIQVAEELNLKLQVVPVETLNEALTFLENLE